MSRWKRACYKNILVQPFVVASNKIFAKIVILIRGQACFAGNIIKRRVLDVIRYFKLNNIKHFGL